MKGLCIEVKPTWDQEPSLDILSVTVYTTFLASTKQEINPKPSHPMGHTYRKEGKNVGPSCDTQAHYST
jgi:hypothetical protein